MERINREEYACGGRNFSIETHREGDDISFAVFDQSREDAPEKISIANRFTTTEDGPSQTLASALYQRYLQDIKHRIAVYTEQWQPKSEWE